MGTLILLTHANLPSKAGAGVAAVAGVGQRAEPLCCAGHNFALNPTPATAAILIEGLRLSLSTDPGSIKVSCRQKDVLSDPTGGFLRALSGKLVQDTLLSRLLAILLEPP